MFAGQNALMLKMRKQKFRKVKQTAQGHTAIAVAEPRQFAWLSPTTKIQPDFVRSLFFSDM